MKGLTFVIDASGSVLKCAAMRDGIFIGGVESEGGAAENFPFAIRKLLKISSASGTDDIDNFAVCEGPGSMLGTRVASAAVSSLVSASKKRAKIFSYDSLVCAARVLISRGEKNFCVVAPSRKGFANLIEVSGGEIKSEREVVENFAFPQNSFLLRQRPSEALSGLKDANIQMYEECVAALEISSEVKSGTIEAKTLTKREYVKWKAQARI